MYLCSRCGHSYSHDRSCSRHKLHSCPLLPAIPLSLQVTGPRRVPDPPDLHNPPANCPLDTPPPTPTKLPPAALPSLQPGLDALLPTPPPTPTKLWPASLKHGIPPPLTAAPPSIQPGLPGLLPTPPLTPTKLLPAPHPALQSGLTAPLPTAPTNVLPAALQHGLPAPLTAHPTKLRPAALLPLNPGLPARCRLHHCPALLPLTQPVACLSSLRPVFAVPPYCQLQSPLLPLLSRPAGAP